MTGRGVGFCTGNGMPGYANSLPGRGFGFGWGGGGGRRGRRNGFNAWGFPGWTGFVGGVNASNPDAEKRLLKSRVDYLQSELESVKKQLSEIESDKSRVE